MEKVEETRSQREYVSDFRVNSWVGHFALSSRLPGRNAKKRPDGEQCTAVTWGRANARACSSYIYIGSRSDCRAAGCEAGPPARRYDRFALLFLQCFDFTGRGGSNENRMKVSLTLVWKRLRGDVKSGPCISKGCTPLSARTSSVAGAAALCSVPSPRADFNRTCELSLSSFFTYSAASR